MLNQDGAQIKGVAKGARKPGSRVGARLELYSVVDAMLHQGKSLDIITEVRTIDDNSACRSDVEHSAAAAVVVEMVEKVTRDSYPEPLLYQMSLEALRTIGQSTGVASELIAVACVVKISSVIGYRPTANEMADSHFEKPEIINWIQSLLAKRFVELLQYDQPEYRPISSELLTFAQNWTRDHLEITLKSLEFIKQLL